jgi:hypothetical protein
MSNYSSERIPIQDGNTKLEFFPNYLNSPALVRRRFTFLAGELRSVSLEGYLLRYLADSTTTNLWNLLVDFVSLKLRCPLGVDMRPNYCGVVQVRGSGGRTTTHSVPYAAPPGVVHWTGGPLRSDGLRSTAPVGRLEVDGGVQRNPTGLLANKMGRKIDCKLW